MGQVNMGQIIEYYIPEKFIRVQAKWMPEATRGKVIGFERKALVKVDDRLIADLTSRWVAFSPR